LLHHPLDEGFGFVPNLAVDAHVGSRHREQDLGQIISKRPELLGIGIDETTAVLVHDDDCQAIGEGKVWIWDGRQHDGHGYLVLHAGQHFRLGAPPVIPLR